MRKVFRIIMVTLFVVLVVYSILLFDTNSVVQDVEAVFGGKVNSKLTEGKPINRYNVTQNYPDAVVHLHLHRIFTLHNFRDGYIWARYTCTATSKIGDINYGDANIYTKWKIHKKGGKWEIVHIYENP